MLLEEIIGRDYTLRGTGRWLRSVEHDSLVVNVEDQVFFWNSRGIMYGGVKEWYELVKGVKFDASKFVAIVPEPLAVEKADTVVQDATLVDAFHKAGIRNRDYWHDKRGYTDTTIDRFKLGYSGKFHTIPIYEDGKFVNFQCRIDNPKTVKHWYRGVGPHTFNFGVLAYNDWVVITEGPVDAIMLRQNGIPAVSQTSGAGDTRLYEKNFHKFNNVARIYIVYDNDQAGTTGATKLKGVFGDRAKVYNMWDFGDKYDVTDFFKDGNTKEQFVELLRNNSKETL